MKLLLVIPLVLTLSKAEISLNRCDIFNKVAQTENSNSQIHLAEDGTFLYNNPDNLLDTPQVVNKQIGWNPDIWETSCRDINQTAGDNQTCQSSGILATSLDAVTILTPTYYSFNIVNNSSTEIWFDPDDGDAAKSGDLLTQSEYEYVTSSWYPNLDINFSITNSVSMVELATSNAPSTNLHFKSDTNNSYNLYIADFVLEEDTTTTMDNLAMILRCFFSPRMKTIIYFYKAQITLK